MKFLKQAGFLCLILCLPFKLSSQESKYIDSLNELSWRTIYTDKLLSVQSQEEAFNRSKKINYIRGEAEALLNKGILLFSNGDYPSALSALHVSLDIAQTDPSVSSLTGLILNQISRIYIELGDFTNAREYLDKAVEFNRNSGDSSQLAGNFINYGIVMSHYFEFDDALDYYHQALGIYTELGDTIGMITAYNNLGTYMAENFRPAEEREYYRMALAISEKNPELKAQVLYNIAESWFTEGNFNQALSPAVSAYKLSQDIGYLNGLKLSSALISRIHEEGRRYGPALEYFKFYKAYSDSLINDVTLKKLTETELRSFYRDQMRTDSLKNAQAEFERELIYQGEISRQKMWAVSGSAGFLLMLSLAVVLYRSNRRKQETNRIITTQKQVVESQKVLVEEKNKEILDSIHYARRLQQAILPPDRLVSDLLPDSFIFYKPKDIVAGDFYFLDSTGDDLKSRNIFFAVADCTGHGVPGAMVSVVGSNGLKRCIKEFGITEPGRILDRLSMLVTESFEQSEIAIRDGMDISLCSYLPHSNKLFFAGANNPLWIINKTRKSWPENAKLHPESSLGEIKATKQPVGYYENRIPFETHDIDLEPGDCIYLFSDGFADQFGGENGKKYKAANFRKLLASISHLPMTEQSALINDAFHSWKGDLEQVDDVCILGFRV